MYTYSIIGFVPSDNTLDCNNKSVNDINIPHCCTSILYIKLHVNSILNRNCIRCFKAL